MSASNILLFTAAVILGTMLFIATYSPTPPERAPALVEQDMFYQPQAGDAVRIELGTGRIVQGEITGLTGDGVEINSGLRTETFSREQIAAESRRLLFTDDYYTRPVTGRVTAISNVELIRRLAEGTATPESLGIGSNIQYIIMGEKSIFLYDSAATP